MNIKTKFVMKFHIDLFVIYKSKSTITLNSMLRIVGIMNIMKINEHKINQRIYECKIWFNGLKYIKTCSFIWNKMLKFKTSKIICNHNL